MTVNRLFSAALSIFAGLALFSSHANAAYVTFTGDAGGFVADSATAPYLTAQGTPTEFLSFNTDKNGDPVTITNPNGNIFSNDVIFSSLVSATFGGTASAQVDNGNPDSGASEIGPIQGFGGVLDIDFLAAGNTAGAVGFGPVQLQDASGAIRIYDQTNTLVMTVSPANYPEFSFFGIVGDSGSRIGRIELDGSFFAIQDIQYTTNASTATPEPGSMLLCAAGLLSLVFVRRVRSSSVGA